MKQLTELYSWKNLEKHALSSHFSLPLLTKTPRLNYQAFMEPISLDYRNQRIDDTALYLLLELSQERLLQEKIDALISGNIVNYSEQRPALHTALRALSDKPILVNGQDVMPDILQAQEQMRLISNQIRAGEWLGCTGKVITDIINIGIGGSDLGPKFCLYALSDLTAEHLQYHFISDCDPQAFNRATHRLNPETTLFIISSKSFTTPETLYNAKKALLWLPTAHKGRHFIAITAHPKRASHYGIRHIIPIWDWVGGRYSVCSAINLITCIAIGFERFLELLIGAQAVDKHFHQTPFAQNIPVLLALLGIWNNNFLHAHNLLVLIYSQLLERFLPYIQQLDMESNGKSIDNLGKNVSYATGPIVWGGPGSQAQHSYYQLLCQGTHKVAIDFITLDGMEQELLYKFAVEKQKMLAYGIGNTAQLHHFIPGNISSNHLQLKHISPTSIGALCALYEHKIFTQGVIWDINPFDQPGVESTKSSQGFKASELLV